MAAEALKTMLSIVVVVAFDEASFREEIGLDVGERVYEAPCSQAASSAWNSS